MSASTNEFTVSLTVDFNSNSLAPAMEFYCQQNDFCTYTSPTYKGISSPAVFADFSQYRGNLASVSSLRNEIEIQDGSGLYGTVCTGDADACGAILYRIPDGRRKSASCPIGTEMVLSASGPVGTISYALTPAPRVILVGDMPSTCIFVNGGYRCEPGQVTLRFARVESPCDISSAEDCPFPLVGRPYGTCAAKLPCTELN